MTNKAEVSSEVLEKIEKLSAQVNKDFLHLLWQSIANPELKLDESHLKILNDLKEIELRNSVEIIFNLIDNLAENYDSIAIDLITKTLLKTADLDKTSSQNILTQTLAITSIATFSENNSDFVHFFTNSESQKSLLKFLQSDHSNTVEMALWTIKHLCDQSHDFKSSLAAQEEVMEVLNSIFQQSESSFETELNEFYSSLIEEYANNLAASVDQSEISSTEYSSVHTFSENKDLPQQSLFDEEKIHEMTQKISDLEQEIDHLKSQLRSQESEIEDLKSQISQQQNVAETEKKKQSFNPETIQLLENSLFVFNDVEQPQTTVILGSSESLSQTQTDQKNKCCIIS